MRIGDVELCHWTEVTQDRQTKNFKVITRNVIARIALFHGRIGATRASVTTTDA